MSRSLDQMRTLDSTRKVYLQQASPLEGHRGKAGPQLKCLNQGEGSVGWGVGRGGHLMATAACSRGHLALDEWLMEGSRPEQIHLK